MRPEGRRAHQRPFRTPRSRVGTSVPYNTHTPTPYNTHTPTPYNTHTHPPTHPPTLLPLRQLPDRQSPHPLACRREDGVAHGGRDRPHGRLADPALLVVAGHDVHLDHRHLVDVHHRGIGEVALLHPAALAGDLAVQRRRQALHDPALELRLDLAHVHGRPAVDGAD